MLHKAALSSLLVSLSLAGCSKSGDSGSSTANEVPEVRSDLSGTTEADEKSPPENNRPLEFVGEPVKQSADFPVEQWVRTTTFDGRPFLGFTYVDRSKGNSIKGELTDGVSPEELSKKLQGAPGYTLQPIPAGHPITPASPEEVEELGLPTSPEWLSFFK